MQMNVWLYVLAVFMPGKSAVHTQKLLVLESNVLQRAEGGPPPVYEMYAVHHPIIPHILITAIKGIPLLLREVFSATRS